MGPIDAMFNRILVVCLGNVCRSPMAQAMLRQKLPTRAEVSIDSAGINALVGHPMTETAQAVLRERDIAMNDHRAKQVTAEMLQTADVVLAMEGWHLKRLYELAPAIRGRAFLLGHWNGPLDIPDPFQQQRPAYEHVYRLIDETTDAWLARLIRAKP